jgi:parallel beta-helix repeat protein
MKERKAPAVCLVAVFWLAVVTPALAQEEPQLLAGTTEGTGTYFEVTDSDYLNVTLESSEAIILYLESFPQMVLMHLEAAEGATSTLITLGGFTPSTTYYLYEDDYHSVVAMTTGADGRYSYVQDLSDAHLVFIQPNPSTKRISDDADGGDCTSIGTWDPGTKTCTLTMDVDETTAIAANDVTLDGGGYTVRGTGQPSPDSHGIVVSGRTGVTIQNLNVENFWTGIFLYESSSTTLTGNTASSNRQGIRLWGSSSNMLDGNTAFDNGTGIFLRQSTSNTLTGNTASSNSIGIYLFESSDNTLDGNTAEGSWSAGILVGGSRNMLINNTARWNNKPNTLVAGIELRGSSHELVGNIASGNACGIWLRGGGTNPTRFNTLRSNTTSWNDLYGIAIFSSTSNTLTGNTISRNGRFGVSLHKSNWNKIYNNNFIWNSIGQASVDQGTGNLFNEPRPTGGNYWSNWTTPDGDGDGIVDVPYVFDGGTDYLPWAVQDGWEDLEAPSIILADPEPVAVGTGGTLTATVDDAGRGDSDIFSAECSLDGGDWVEMHPSDGLFDSPTENARCDFTAPQSSGVYELCIRATDVRDNVSDPECALLVVFDPDAGFVTGVGWIYSPPGSYFPDELPFFEGSFYELVSSPGISWNEARSAAAGANAAPCASPHLVTVTSQAEQDFLYDEFGAALAEKWYGAFDDTPGDPSEGWQWVTGEPWSYTNWLAGEPSDGYPLQPYLQAYPSWGPDMVKFWGDNGYPIDGNPPAGYVIEYDDCLSGKANFGFVSRYQKGAEAPMGITQFRFHAAGLNFHSDSYEWLVVTGSDYARFKGVGTIKGEGEYRFMVWAGDGDPDTFRIRIWTENEETAVETVIYDNGSDQEIGGGSIVIHAK